MLQSKTETPSFGSGYFKKSAMTTIVKIHRKGQMTIPSRLRAAVGMAEGDLVEATVYRGKIMLTPKVPIDRSKFPNADDEYTPEQRRIIDARLDESDKDLKKGRTFGPFDTAEEMIASMKAELQKKAQLRKGAVKNTKAR
jgi:AbrB family looped-hinge helix DNA binding protein